jgi:para-aminobenzoate synthetase component 1
MAYCIWKSYKFKEDPFLIFTIIKDQQNCFFLDSSLRSATYGRYSFLGCNPFFVFKAKDKSPLVILRKIFNRYKINSLSGISPFPAGAVGYLSYDLGFVLEKKLQKNTSDDLGIPDCFFGFYSSSITVDHLKKTLYISASGFPEKKYHLARLLARSNLQKTLNLLRRAEPVSFKDRSLKSRRQQKDTSALRANFSKQEYLRAVKRAKDYIRKGDIYQVNLSQRFNTKTSLSSFEIYRRLRLLSPTCFSAYLDCGDFQIISSSPERFLRLDGEAVYTQPMKGTRPRSPNKAKDRYLKKQLYYSPKDKAELMMIVDLQRNDLGRVCSYGTVRVDTLREIQTYKTVFQTTATIKGTLHKDNDRFDLLRAAFPGGSITGCPKIRAMQIIEELEPHRRNIYTGSLGYLSFSGQMDLNILIRTMLKKGSHVYFGAGGGIVADSNPEAEYEETLVKAKAMIKALS